MDDFPNEERPFSSSSRRNGIRYGISTIGIVLYFVWVSGISTSLFAFFAGKTVQTISVIGHLMYSELLVGPFLVVVPQSTADNWLLEFKVIAV